MRRISSLGFQPRRRSNRAPGRSTRRRSGGRRRPPEFRRRRARRNRMERRDPRSSTASTSVERRPTSPRGPTRIGSRGGSPHRSRRSSQAAASWPIRWAMIGPLDRTTDPVSITSGSRVARPVRGRPPGRTPAPRWPCREGPGSRPPREGRRARPLCGRHHGQAGARNSSSDNDARRAPRRPSARSIGRRAFATRGGPHVQYRPFQ